MNNEQHSETKCKGCKEWKECTVYGYQNPEPYYLCKECINLVKSK